MVMAIDYTGFVSFPIAPATPPTSISVIQVGSRHVNISWSPPLVRDKNGIIRLYKIRLRLGDSDAGSYTTSQTRLTISSLLPYHVYTFTVVAITVYHGPESNPLEFRTLEDGVSSIKSLVARLHKIRTSNNNNRGL